ncbi:MAG: nitroreductase family protein [Actinobacteria bacterium]|nr:nitroreductase family protein [Actinomycetota bacterium]
MTDATPSPDPGPLGAPGPSAAPDADALDADTLLRATGSVREFTDRPVTRAEVARILDLARFAPSGGNQQPWHVVSVEAPAVRAALGECIVTAAKEYLTLRTAGQRPFGLTVHGRWPGPGPVDLAAARAADLDAPAFTGLAQAPAVLAVLVELGKLAAMDAELDRHGVVAGASIYPFCWQILLAARLEGLGGVLTTFAVRDEPTALAALGAPPGWALAAVIALGEPVHRPTRLRREPVAAFATVDGFAGPALTP